MGRPRLGNKGKVVSISFRVPMDIKNRFQVRSIRDGGMSKVMEELVRRYLDGIIEIREE